MVTPWFKFYAADYLLDADVDGMPREAEALLIRMWCVCHLEGSCPSDADNLARKTRLTLQYVSQYKSHCEPFFELQDGKFVSPRMQDEKRRSEQARQNANKRYEKNSLDSKSLPEPKSSAYTESERGSAIRTAVRTADGSAKASRPRKCSIPENFTISDRVRKWALDHGYTNLDTCLEHFKGKALANGYQYIDWDQAFINAIREGWANPNHAQQPALPSAVQVAVQKSLPNPADLKRQRLAEMNGS